MKKQKIYRVLCKISSYGYFYVEAPSVKEAKNNAFISPYEMGVDFNEGERRIMGVTNVTEEIKLL